MNFLRILSITLFFTWIIFSFFYSKDIISPFFIKGNSFSFESLWEDSLQEEGYLSTFIIFSPNFSFWEGQEVSFSLKDKGGENFLEVQSSFVQNDSIAGLTSLEGNVSFFSSSLAIKVEGESFKWDKNYSFLESEGESPISFEGPFGSGQAFFFSWDLVENKIYFKNQVKGSFDNEKN